MTNKWQDVKNYVNSNENFTRKEMTKFFENFSHTEDQYILFLKHCGFIERISTAKYKRIVKIPDFVSSSLASELSYNKEKREKVMLKLIRKQKLENIKIGAEVHIFSKC